MGRREENTELFTSPWLLVALANEVATMVGDGEVNHYLTVSSFRFYYFHTKFESLFPSAA
jgi:hypothetical protein